MHNYKFISWGFAIFVCVIGILDFILVHPILGIIYFLVSLIFFPFTNKFLKLKFNTSIHPIVKILLGVFIFMFTFGVSDLGDIFDKFVNENLK